MWYQEQFVTDDGSNSIGDFEVISWNPPIPSNKTRKWLIACLHVIVTVHYRSTKDLPLRIQKIFDFFRRCIAQHYQTTGRYCATLEKFFQNSDFSSAFGVKQEGIRQTQSWLSGGFAHFGIAFNQLGCSAEATEGSLFQMESLEESRAFQSAGNVRNQWQWADGSIHQRITQRRTGKEPHYSSLK